MRPIKTLLTAFLFPLAIGGCINDQDGDGFSVDEGDCDDADPAVNPNAVEVANGVDDNCDGAIDIDADQDGDGFTIGQNDCNDTNPFVNPNAEEVPVNGVDDNCDGNVDTDVDQDNDGVTLVQGDCNDNNPAISPLAPEVANGADDNCDGFIDNIASPGDNDGDGFQAAGGDCNDNDFLVNPGAIEVNGDTVDNNCDGNIDAADPACAGQPIDGACVLPCDQNLGNAALDFAKAMGFCSNEVISAQFINSSGNSGPARAIVQSFGGTGELNTPAEGTRMVVLSSGFANNNAHDQGFAFDGTGSPGADPNVFPGECSQFANPDLTVSQGCGGGDAPPLVCDYTELQLTIRVPTNAQSFSFDFEFFSSEYPTFHCSAFNDVFLAELTSQAFNNGQRANVSFDANGSVVSVNNGFFQVCTQDDPFSTPPNICLTNVDANAILANTGFDPNNGGDFSSGAGATLSLTTQGVPVLPGETITLSFMIFDLGDDILDSSVIIDNFRWSALGSEGPKTIP